MHVYSHVTSSQLQSQARGSEDSDHLELIILDGHNRNLAQTGQVLNDYLYVPKSASTTIFSEVYLSAPAQTENNVQLSHFHTCQSNRMLSIVFEPASITTPSIF